MAAHPSGSPEARRAKLFQLADEVGFDRPERIALAEVMLRRDFVSWSQLDASQVDRLLDAFEGHEKIERIIADRVRNRTG